MSVEVRVPQLGESIVEATVGTWLKHEGDAIAAGDALVELETDKVNMEVAAPEGGMLQSITKGEGETVAIGDILAMIAPGQAAANATGDGNRSASSAQPTAPAEAPSPVAAQTTQAASPPAGNETTPTVTADDDGDGSRSTPLARRIAAEHGMDISSIKGTGPSGRITKDDVTAFLQTDGGQPQTPVPSQSVSPPAPTAPAPRIPTPVGNRSEERVRMSRRRQTIARRLVEAQHTAAMLTTFNEVDMSAIMDIRKRRRDAFKERHGVGLGFMSFFTKAAIGALKEYPRLNAEIQGDEFVLKHYYDIGVAVGTEEGLVVPIVRDADTLSFAEIERRVGDLAARARSRQLTLEELQGGTFTLTNGGIYGSLMSTPILNTPQVGILGMHKIQERPVVVNGQIVIRPMMYLALSYDHRIVDGSEAVRFLVHIKDLIEDPTFLLVEG